MQVNHYSNIKTKFRNKGYDGSNSDAKKEEIPTEGQYANTYDHHRRIGFGFAYMGHRSGHFSEAYVLCKNDMLSQVRMGAYESADEIATALGSCDGVTR